MPVDFRFSHQVGKVLQAALQTMLALLLLSSAMTAHSASKTIVVLGDSLSAEYGLARGQGWVSLLQKKLATEHIDAQVINASISGDTTSGGKARLQTLLDKHRPSILVIELGANDALRGLSLAATRENLRAMIGSAKNAGAKVLIVGMQIPPNYGQDYTRQFAKMFADLSRENKTPLVPFMLADVADKPEMFQADRMHPTSEAHPVILNNIWPQLKRLLSNR
ncbi:MAG TPA: arylesterase [Herminiimonas sp.]|nr:arylesterase [Herminiimonas sp.]